MFDRGDIVLIEYPYTDKAAAKLRPALVIQGFGPFFIALTAAGDQALGRNAVFLPITSVIKPGAHNVVVPDSDPAFAQSGLKVSSTILCWNVNTISKAFVSRTIGTLADALMEQVEDAVRRVLGLA